MRSLHQLGRCYLLPRVDYMDYTSAGIVVPKKSEYDGACRLCAREGLRDGEDLSATVLASLPSPKRTHQWPLPRSATTVTASGARGRPRRPVAGPIPSATERGARFCPGQNVAYKTPRVFGDSASRPFPPC